MARGLFQLSALGLGSNENGSRNREPEAKELFLTQEIQVGVAARTCIDDSGKIPRNVIVVVEWKGKGKLQRNLGLAD